MLWGFCPVRVYSFIETFDESTYTNKNCEGTQKGIFGRWCNLKYCTCNEVISNKKAIKFDSDSIKSVLYHPETPYFFLISFFTRFP
jgi:hypothetical protein